MLPEHQESAGVQAHITKQHEKKKLPVLRLLLFIPGVLAAVLLLFVSAQPYVRAGQETPELVILGDSIMGKEREVTTVASVMEEVSGLQIFNGAFGGSCASSNNLDNRYSYHEDSLNLCRLQDAICNRDFGVQLADLPVNPYQSAYFPETLQQLSQIDFTKVRYLLIEHGTNDYSSGRALDDEKDPMNVYTFGGALRFSIRNLQKTYPKLQIILVTPNFCHISGYEDCAKQSFGYGTMEDYAALEKKIAAQYGITLIDAYHEDGFNADNVLSLTEDGIHLNEDGRKQYGTYLGEQLKQLNR